jgi:hypothetical protein
MQAGVHPLLDALWAYAWHCGCGEAASGCGKQAWEAPTTITGTRASCCTRQPRPAALQLALWWPRCCAV